MQTIHKYSVSAYGESGIYTHRGAKILSVGEQYGQPVIWALVDPNEPMEYQYLLCMLTGAQTLRSDIGTFIGTVQMPNDYVAHFFLRK